MWWFLAREVLRLRGTISRELPWEVMPGKLEFVFNFSIAKLKYSLIDPGFVDLFFYRDPEDAEKEEQARKESLAAQAAAAVPAKAAEENWGEEMTTDWANEPAPGAAPAQKPVVGTHLLKLAMNLS